MTMNVKMRCPKLRPPCSTRRISATSRAPSAPSSTATSPRAKPGNTGSRRCSRSSGPGLIVMAGDNDAGAFATYGQAGQTYGTTLLWTLALLIPVLYVNQEMVLRLGAVTGVGHARLIFERFGKFWALQRHRPLPAQRADDRHRVHRHQPRARLSRSEQGRRRPRRRRSGDARREHGGFPAVRALHHGAGVRAACCCCRSIFSSIPRWRRSRMISSCRRSLRPAR